MHDPNASVLAAINARYSHTSLGARFLLENSGPALATRTRLLEFSLNDAPDGMAARILETRPAVLGLGVYIWNRPQAEALVALIRQMRPETRIVLGGPEITYDADSPLGRGADCVIRGEGEVLWPRICQALLAGEAVPRLPAPEPPDAAALRLPVDSYSEADLRHRNVYVEASRGCPLACDFCLSAAVSGVRHFPEQAVFEALQRLMDRGARSFRFIDRSFNLGGRRAERLLGFFLEHLVPGLRLHFEMTPDGLHDTLRGILRCFPPRCLHVETGVQSFNPDVLVAVNRYCDPAAAAEGIAWLVSVAKADVHADLIAGLPGESLAGVAAGFDRLYRLGPAEIQVGILKQLHGTPLRRTAAQRGLRFRETPPYDVQSTADMSVDDLDAVRRFASHWERVVNRGHFPRATARLLQDADSPWQRFDAFSRRLAARHGLSGIGLVELAAALLDFLCRECGQPAADARRLLRDDYLDNGRRIHLPAMLRA